MLIVRQYAAFGDGVALFKVRSSMLVKTMETKCANRVFAEACITNTEASAGGDKQKAQTTDAATACFTSGTRGLLPSPDMVAMHNRA